MTTCQQTSWYTEEPMLQKTQASTGKKTQKRRYGIIDGGATRTLTSVNALEAMVNENLRKHQDGRVLEVDTSNQPLFAFGNRREMFEHGQDEDCGQLEGWRSDRAHLRQGRRTHAPFHPHLESLEGDD